MQLFGPLNLLMALLGSSWPLLGPIWSQNGPQNVPKNGPKSDQKMIQKMTPKITKNKRILVPKMVSKMIQDGDTEAQANPAGAILEALGPNVSPRWRRIAQDSPKLAQSGSQGAPKMVQDGFK